MIFGIKQAPSRQENGARFLTSCLGHTLGLVRHLVAITLETARFTKYQLEAASRHIVNRLAGGKKHFPNDRHILAGKFIHYRFHKLVRKLAALDGTDVLDHWTYF